MPSPPLPPSLPPPQVHFLYQYSLQFILDIFQVVLNSNPHLKGVTDHSRRLSIITMDMFQVRERERERGNT